MKNKIFSLLKSIWIFDSNVNNVNSEAVKVCHKDNLLITQWNNIHYLCFQVGHLNASLQCCGVMPPQPDKAMANVCTICGIATEKTGRHYGAISCYPCRAFFRRAQV